MTSPAHVIEVVIREVPPDPLGPMLDAMTDDQVLGLLGPDWSRMSRAQRDAYARPGGSFEAEALPAPRRRTIAERAGTDDVSDSRYLVELYNDCIASYNALRRDLDNPRYPDDWKLESRRMVRRLVDGIARIELILETRDDVERIDPAEATGGQ